MRLNSVGVLKRGGKELYSILTLNVTPGTSGNRYPSWLAQSSTRWMHTTNGEGKDGEISETKGTQDVEMRSHNIEFPDPTDPFSNPLAQISAESLNKGPKFWQGAKPGPVARMYERKVDENGEAYAKGGRKCSFARVWVREGTGTVTVNGRSWVDYFPRVDQRDKILRPMHLLGMTGRFDVRCNVNGGGQTGQAEAIRFSLSRALQNWEPTWRPTLKKEGLLRRDARIVEPKKAGRKKARKSFQWVKR